MRCISLLLSSTSINVTLHTLRTGSADLSRRIDVTDLGGVSRDVLYSTLKNNTASSPLSPKNAQGKTFLITPSYLFSPASFSSLHSADQSELCCEPLFHGESFGIHVDMDRLDELWAGRKRGLGVGVWEVKRKGECREMD